MLPLPMLNVMNYAKNSRKRRTEIVNYIYGGVVITTKKKSLQRMQALSIRMKFLFYLFKLRIGYIFTGVRLCATVRILRTSARLSGSCL